MDRQMTLSQAVWSQSSLLRNALLVLGGSVLVAIGAQISVPFWPVPVTLQMLAVLMVGFTLGSRLGGAALLAYLAEGAMGLPVFAGGNGGLAYMAGPTLGFLLGFVAVAWAAGLAAERGIAKGFIGTAIAALVLSAALYIPGLAWPMAVASVFGIEAGWIGQDFVSYYWAYFVQPFVLGDAVKALIAALVVSGAWAALRDRKA